ncbi:unnamed protein product [Trichobilharzia regenti]|nr:unnamed protein product [Trichobilharzia regenti]
MEGGQPIAEVCSYSPNKCAEVINGSMHSSSTSDSDYEYRKRNSYCLSCQRRPKASLKFILTIWYSPETSSAIAGKCLFVIFCFLLANTHTLLNQLVGIIVLFTMCTM